MLLTETAFAKINLALHVRRRRDDGYHELETLFAFLDNGDQLIAEAADTLSLTITGPFGIQLAAEGDNLVLRAAEALQQAMGVPVGARIILDKKLPIAAGIGGGSADAAATLRLLCRLWGVDGEAPIIPDIAARLGADVPACLSSQTLFGAGVGDKLTRCKNAGVEGLSILLLNPMVACPTGPVFATWDGIDRGGLDPLNWRYGRNDLMSSAVKLVPEIADCIHVLEQFPGAVLARMSGSGATCFALFETDEARDAASLELQTRHPLWWTMAGCLR